MYEHYPVLPRILNQTFKHDQTIWIEYGKLNVQTVYVFIVIIVVLASLGIEI